MSVERVYFSPERFNVENLKPGDTFSTPSGLGGTYDVQFVREDGRNLVLKLISGDEVNGRLCAVPRNEAPFRLFTHRDKEAEYLTAKELPAYAIDRTQLSHASLDKAAARAHRLGFDYVAVHMPLVTAAFNPQDTSLHAELADGRMLQKLESAGFGAAGSPARREVPVFIELLKNKDVEQRRGGDSPKSSSVVGLPGLFKQFYYEADANYRLFETSPGFVREIRGSKYDRGESAPLDPIRDAIRLGRDAARVELYMMNALLEGSGVQWEPEIRTRYEDALMKLSEAVESCEQDTLKSALHGVAKPLGDVVMRGTINKVDTSTQLTASLKWAEIHGVASPDQAKGRHR